MKRLSFKEQVVMRSLGLLILVAPTKGTGLFIDIALDAQRMALAEKRLGAPA